jgi:peroxisomal 3,2-trans-enoyl-CoA isomerase
MTIRLNRPKKLNSVTRDMYAKMTSLMHESNEDDSIKMTLLTGSGPYYSAGNDLSAFASIGDDVARATSEATSVMIAFLDSFIDSKKPVVAGVNGPCIGIMMTTLGLVDVVWCSETATFSAPFSATAQSPEGASSLTFPALMGRSFANEVLMFNRKLTAEEALKVGFVSRILDSRSFLETAQSTLNALLEENSTASMQKSKSLQRSPQVKADLKTIVRQEADLLVQSWLDPEFPNFVLRFLSSRKK